MECPKCKTELFCPCKHCRPREKDKQPKWVWLKGDIIKCPNCNYKNHCDNWIDGGEVK